MKQFALALMIAVQMQVPPVPEHDHAMSIETLSLEQVGFVSFTLEIRDPSACGPDDPCDPEFYESYGVLFAKDARDDGPICLEQEGEPKYMCLTLGELRRLIFERN